MRRSNIQKFKDLITAPIRGLTLFENDKWGLSALRSERFDYVAREVIGYCLDIGCGKKNLFINIYLNGNGKGIDVFPYEGLSEENIIKDSTYFPFDDAFFNSVTFIASINHIPKTKRDLALKQAYRCLKSGGNIVVTMGHPIAELFMHNYIKLYDKIFGTHYDIDSIRGMEDGEAYYLTDSEIMQRISKAGFKNIKKKYFLTQLCLNHLFVGFKY